MQLPFYVSLALHLCDEALHSGEDALLILLHSLQKSSDLNWILLMRNGVINALFLGI